MPDQLSGQMQYQPRERPDRCAAQQGKIFQIRSVPRAYKLGKPQKPQMGACGTPNHQFSDEVQNYTQDAAAQVWQGVLSLKMRGEILVPEALGEMLVGPHALRTS